MLSGDIDNTKNRTKESVFRYGEFEVYLGHYVNCNFILKDTDST